MREITLVMYSLDKVIHQAHCILTLEVNYSKIISHVNITACQLNLAPIVEARLLGEGNPIVGESFILTCSVHGAEKLSSNMTYQWTRIETHIISSMVSTLTFSPFKLSDAGNYICTVNISSEYLDNILSAHSSTQLNVESKCLLSHACICHPYYYILQCQTQLVF